jgi:hypothetical protein
MLQRVPSTKNVRRYVGDDGGKTRNGPRQALLGVENLWRAADVFSVCFETRVTRARRRQCLLANSSVADRQVETDKQNAQAGDRDAKTVGQACEPLPAYPR